MTSQPGQQAIVIHILPNISRSKGKQTVKLSQLIECNTKNIFLKKSYTKCDGETGPRPFSEKLKLSISLDQQSKVLYSLFLLYTKLRAITAFHTRETGNCKINCGNKIQKKPFLFTFSRQKYDITANSFGLIRYAIIISVQKLTQVIKSNTAGFLRIQRHNTKILKRILKRPLK